MGKLYKIIKNNFLVRGAYMLFMSYFSISRKQFGYCADNVTITPP